MVVWVRLPEVPVTVNVYVWRGNLFDAVSVSVDVEVVGFVLNEPVRPLGSPETESVTEPVKPFSLLTVTV